MRKLRMEAIAQGALALAALGWLVSSITDIDTLDAAGFGTLLLALATFILAGFTLATLKAAEKERGIASQALKVSQDQTEIAQAALDAEYQPLLIDVLQTGDPPPGLPAEGPPDLRLPSVSVGKRYTHVMFPLRNVGRGVAVIDQGGDHSHRRLDR
jgi:hypothetical protein